MNLLRKMRFMYKFTKDDVCLTIIFIDLNFDNQMGVSF